MSLGHPLWLAALVVPVASLAWLWRAGPGRPTPHLLLRVGALALLVLALAQPRAGSGSGAPTMLVIDRSASIPPATRAREEGWVRAAVSGGSCVRPCRAVEFASGARLVGLGRGRGPLSPLATGPDTDIAAAVTLGAGVLRAGDRMVVLSDGLPTVGDATAAVAAARARGITVSTVDLGADRRPDAAMTRFAVQPATAHAGDPLSASLTIHTTTARRAVVTVSLDGGVIDRQALSLRPGDDPLALRLAAPSPGWHVYRAAVSTAPDAEARNDSLTAAVDVHPPPVVWLVGDSGPAERGFATLLADAGFIVRPRAPAQLPARSAALQGADAVILNDLPAAALDHRQVAALSGAVSHRGLGLLVLGGAHSLSLGGYAGSQLDRLLPVASLPPGNRQRGTVGLELVLDRSGSMGDLAGGVAKIAMTQAAAWTAAGFIAARGDQLGIVSFDANAHVLVGMGSVRAGAELRRVDADIAALSASGGTNINRALQAGVGQVLRSDAPNRHLILVTDGVSESARYEPLLQALGTRRISLSTIAIGGDTNRRLLRSLAARGHGRFYAVADAHQLPDIFLREAKLSVRPVSVRGRLPLSVGAVVPAVRSALGRRLGALPRNVATDLRPRALADVVAGVGGQSRQPVLAQWQYGVGRVAVWTPGIDPRWTGALAGEGRLLGDTVRWLQRAATPSPALPALDPADPRIVEVDPVAAGAAPLELGSLSGRLAPAAGGSAAGPGSFTLRFTQTAPSHYQAGLPAGVSGARRIVVAGEPSGPARAVLAVPYPAEYRPDPGGGAMLAALAAAGGGTRHVVADTAWLSARRLELWPVLVCLGLVALLAGIVLRLVGTPRLRRGRSRRPPRPHPGSVPPHGSRRLTDDHARGAQRPRDQIKGVN